MKSKEGWDAFYNKVGGKYICSECGNILTWLQRDNAGRVKGTEIILAFVVAIPISLIITPAGGGLLAALYLLNFAKRVGCPICHNKQKGIIPLDTKEGMKIFKNKHPDLADLLEGLSPAEDL